LRDARTGEPGGFNLTDYLLDRHLREGRGQRVAIAGVGPPLTYAELAEWTNRIGNVWRELGIGPGDRVLLILPDSPWLVTCFFATIKIGAVAVPVNPFTRSADYATYAADSGARLVVTHAVSLAEVRRGIEEGSKGRPPRLLAVEASIPGQQSWEDLLTTASTRLETHPTRGDDLAFFLYTSGSGGQPKAAMHRHRHMLATAAGFGRGVLEVTPEDVTFSASKLFFAYGLGNSLTFPFSVGARTVLLPDKPAAEKIFEVIRAYRPSLFFSVPTLYGALLREAEGRQVALPSVREAISAGEPLPVEIFERFRRRFGRTILDGIGTTEMLHMFLSSRPGEIRPGSCGVPVPGYEARIVDENGADVGENEIGNLWVRGASAFAGYWEKPELTQRTKRQDWVITGDKFTRDGDGFYHYQGRADDMLKVAGMWVSPAEVENTLLTHPEVAEAAVVGQRTAEGLIQPVAFIVRGETSPVSCHSQASAAVRRQDLASDLRDLCQQRLPGYKCPTEIHLVPELPKTATGKIQRYRLRDELR
jgi:benzoate-CoA ligase family protein